MKDEQSNIKSEKDDEKKKRKKNGFRRVCFFGWVSLNDIIKQNVFRFHDIMQLWNNAEMIYTIAHINAPKYIWRIHIF